MVNLILDLLIQVIRTSPTGKEHPIPSHFHANGYAEVLPLWLIMVHTRVMESEILFSILHIKHEICRSRLSSYAILSLISRQ